MTAADEARPDEARPPQAGRDQIRPDMSPSERAPRIAIVTVSHRSGRYLDGFLESTTAASAQSVQVIVADNSVTDVESARQSAARHSADFVDVGVNQGYGHAVNHAVRTLAGSIEWVLIANPDVILDAGVIDLLVSTGETDPEVGAVGPEIREVDGTRYPSARSIPSLRTGAGHALFADVWRSNPWTKAYHLDLSHADRPIPAGWLSGACLLVRRSVFDGLGGFDEGYFMYFEDVDLGQRIGEAGYVNLYEPRARVVHVGAHATTGSSALMLAAHHDSAYRFLARRYAGWYFAPLRLVLRGGLAVRRRRATRHAH